MSPIEQIAELPDWRWMPKSHQEMVLTGQGIIGTTDFMYRVGNAAVVGLIYTSLLSPPWMWFALAQGIGIKHLCDFRRLAKLIPEGTTTAVEASFTVGLRFAKLYGFEEMDQEADWFGVSYKIMRKA